MDNFQSFAAFIIVAFALAAILIMKKDSLPAHVKRPLALLTIFLVCLAFFLIIYSFLAA